ncbi:MAG: endonuclease/exonuclease/phosphatase family protein [Chloroflexota bacterium]
MSIDFNVMTWNVENLFPAGHPSGPKTVELYERKMATLTSTILGIAPDVLAVQEVGDPATLADLQSRLGGSFPYMLLSSHPDPRGIRVGMLSRLPLSDARELYDFPPAALTNVTDTRGDVFRHMSRGILKATVVLAPGLPIHIVTIHLKSKLITYANGRRFPLDENERARETGAALLRRACESIAVRVYLDYLLGENDDPLILMGDFNDSAEAVSSQIMFGPEDRSLATPDKFDDIRLYSLDEYIPPDRRFSRLYLKRRELIDHIAVSHELIFRKRQVDSYVEPIENIDGETEWRREATFPDHAPVYARFTLPQPSATGSSITTTPQL